MTKKQEPGLREIPGVGERMAESLQALGYFTVESLKGQNPEDMYERDCVRTGYRLDRCVLYVYRLAVYYADNGTRDPEKLKWWYWKDKSE